MPNFDTSSGKGKELSLETPEDEAKRLAGSGRPEVPTPAPQEELDLIPTPEEERAAQQAIDDEAAKRVLARIQGGEVAPEEALDQRYGMDFEAVASVLRGERVLPYTNLDARDPDFDEDFKTFSLAIKEQEKVVDVLFGRVLAEQATEEEMKLAETYAAHQAKVFGLAGFHDSVPKPWYANERLAEAMAATNPENRRFVEYVRKNFTAERLRAGDTTA